MNTSAAQFIVEAGTGTGAHHRFPVSQHSRERYLYISTISDSAVLHSFPTPEEWKSNILPSPARSRDFYESKGFIGAIPKNISRDGEMHACGA